MSSIWEQDERVQELEQKSLVSRISVVQVFIPRLLVFLKTLGVPFVFVSSLRWKISEISGKAKSIAYELL